MTGRARWRRRLAQPLAQLRQRDWRGRSAAGSIFGELERDHAADEWRGHARARELRVSAAGKSRHDVDARRPQANFLPAAGKIGHQSLFIDGAHGDRLRPASRIIDFVGRAVVRCSAAVVARGTDHEFSGGDRSRQRLLDGRAGHGASHAHGNQVGAGLHGPVDAGRDVLIDAAAVVAQDFAYQQPALRRHAYRCDALVSGSDRAGSVRAVADAVGGAECTAGKVFHVVQGRGQIGMSGVDARVEQGHADALAGGLLPLIGNLVGGQRPVGHLAQLVGPQESVNRKRRQPIDESLAARGALHCAPRIWRMRPMISVMKGSHSPNVCSSSVTA